MSASMRRGAETDLATSTASGRNDALWRPAAAFAICLVGSLGLVAYGLVSEHGIAISLLLGYLVALGLVAGLVAPSLAGFGSALAGGWIGLLGYAIVYSIVNADMAEAGFYNTTGIFLAAVVVPLTVAPGFLPGALVARWSRGGGSRRSRVPIAVGVIVLLAVVGAVSASAAGGSADVDSVTVSVGTKIVTYTDAICDELEVGVLDISAGDGEGAWVALTIPTGGGVPNIVGAIDGVEWHVTENAQATVNADMTGTFSGRDTVIDADIMGSFACH